MLTPPAHRACQTPRFGERARALPAVVALGCLAGSLLPSCAPRAEPFDTAVLLSEKGQDREAIRVLSSEVARHPEKIRERRLLVRLHAGVGDLGAAEREAEALAKRLPPGSPVPFLELGHALELAHRYDEALALYDQATEIAPRDPSGPKTGGLRAARWGEIELAAPRLEEALRRDSRDAETWHALGVVRLRLGDTTGARVAYESGLVADPRALENRVGLATLALAEHRPGSALAEYDRILAERPGYADGYLGRSWALLLLGRHDEARAALDDARRHGADRRATDRQAAALASLRDKRKSQRKSPGNP